MAMSDILGQERALEILRGVITNTRVAHAYIFTGEDGIGKKLSAINFAKTLNCERNLPTGQAGADKKNPGAEVDCCDECSSCIKIDKSIHPDVFFIAPEDGIIKVSAIRTLEESLSYKAFEGGWKIAVIDNAETLNQSAANAFLKTLEEPPDHSLIILISSMPEMIPATIRSRCQTVSFSSLAVDKMVELLESNRNAEGKSIDSEQAALLSTLSCGRPGWALREDLIETRDRLFDKFKRLLGGIEEDIWEDRGDMEDWFEWVQLWLRDIAVFKATGKSALLINHDMEKEIKDISQRPGLREVLKLSETLREIKDNLRFNLNEKLTLNHTYFLLNKTFGSEPGPAAGRARRGINA